MKTIILKTAVMSMIALMIGFNLNAKATKPEKNPDIKSYIENEIKYPSVAKEKLIEGFVLLEFVIEQNGDIVITAINSSNQILLEQVKSQFSNMKWFDKNDIGKKFYYRFEFELL